MKLAISNVELNENLYFNCRRALKKQGWAKKKSIS